MLLMTKNVSWSLSNVLCCYPTRVHKKPVAGTLWYSETLQVGNLSVITEKWSNEIITLAGSVGLNVDTIEWAQGNGISSWVEQDHDYQQFFLSDWISQCNAKSFLMWSHTCLDMPQCIYIKYLLCTFSIFCLGWVYDWHSN